MWSSCCDNIHHGMSNLRWGKRSIAIAMFETLAGFTLSSISQKPILLIVDKNFGTPVRLPQAALVLSFQILMLANTLECRGNTVPSRKSFLCCISIAGPRRLTVGGAKRFTTNHYQSFENVGKLRTFRRPKRLICQEGASNFVTQKPMLKAKTLVEFPALEQKVLWTIYRGSVLVLSRRCEMQ